MDRFERGESVYQAICVPFRHGKSDISSRRFPVWALLRHPDKEVILAGYNQALANSFSLDCQRAFREVGPLYGLSVDRQAGGVESWRVTDAGDESLTQNYGGALHAAGLGATITGKGGAFICIDDYLKNREDAESEVIRAKVWDGFGSDIMTRRAPVCVVQIIANRWGPDDLVGRIINRNDPHHEDYDPQFPRFEIIKYPAWSEDGGWLFPQRYSDHWYESQRAGLGKYAWSAQGLQDPQPRTGQLLRIDMVRKSNAATWPDGLRWVRGWDLASTEKERVKDDPDRTVGTLVGWDGEVLYVRDVIRQRLAVGERDELIVETAKQDPPGTVVKIEAVGGYVDAFNSAKARLRGVARVEKITPHKDKVVRAGALESIFEGGRVMVPTTAPWVEPWLRELGAFPSAAHDDQVDSLVIAADDLLTQRMGKPLFPTLRGEHRIMTEPIVSWDDVRQAYLFDFPQYERLATFEGELLRAAWFDRYGDSACVWAHWDDERTLRVFDAMKMAEGTDLAQFAEAVAARSVDPRGRAHRYRRTLVGGPVPKGGVSEPDLGARLTREIKRFTPEDAKRLQGFRTVEAAALRGSNGLSGLDRMLRGALSGEGDMMFVWPRDVFEAMRDARRKPAKFDADPDEDDPQDAIGGGGPFVRCLQMLGVWWGV